MRFAKLLIYSRLKSQAIMANLVESHSWNSQGDIWGINWSIWICKEWPQFLDRICSDHAELLVSSNTNHVLAKLKQTNSGAQIYCQARGSEPDWSTQSQRNGPRAAGKRMGKSRVIAETGAGQHGVATATMAARFGHSARSTWEPDVERQRPMFSGWNN